MHYSWGAVVLFVEVVVREALLVPPISTLISKDCLKKNHYHLSMNLYSRTWVGATANPFSPVKHSEGERAMMWGLIVIVLKWPCGRPRSPHWLSHTECPPPWSFDSTAPLACDGNRQWISKTDRGRQKRMMLIKRRQWHHSGHQGDKRSGPHVSFLAQNRKWVIPASLHQQPIRGWQWEHASTDEQPIMELLYLNSQKALGFSQL